MTNCVEVAGGEKGSLSTLQHIDKRCFVKLLGLSELYSLVDFIESRIQINRIVGVNLLAKPVFFESIHRHFSTVGSSEESATGTRPDLAAS